MPPFVPEMINQSIILNLGSGPDSPLSVPEKENKFFGIIPKSEKTGKLVVNTNTDSSQLVLDIKNSFCVFLKKIIRKIILHFQTKH